MITQLKKAAGFTLFEAIAVISIMAIIGVYVSSQWQGSNISVVTQANQLASDIRYTQALSMSSNQRYRLVINTATNSYQILNAAGTAITLPLGGNRVSLPAHISFGTLTNLPNSLIAFSTQGAPYVSTGSPGTALTAIATIPLVQVSITRTVAISPNTGRAVVQ